MNKSRIREARHAAGLTQAAVADAVGISGRHFKGIEYYDTAPSVWLAQRIAREIGVTVAELWPLSERDA